MSEYKSGIYCLRNKINNKVYIGSAKNLHIRKNAHFNNLRKNKHENKRLQNSWNTYGKDNFEYFILCYIENEVELRHIEYLYIQLFNSLNRDIGFNISENTNTCVLSGENSHRAKLTNNQVKEIKKLLFINELSQPEIARLYNVKISTIENIKHIKAWAKVIIPECTNEELKNIPSKGNKILEDKNIKEIKQMLYNKKTCAKIANIFNVGESTINYIKSGKRYSNININEATNEEIKNIKNKPKFDNIAKQSISNANKGKKHWLGKNHSQETKDKISIANTGKIHTEETKKIWSKQRTGENNPKSKLIESQVIDIKKLLILNTYKLKEIANMFNVSTSVIKHIKHNRAWSHICIN